MRELKILSEKEQERRRSSEALPALQRWSFDSELEIPKLAGS